MIAKKKTLAELERISEREFKEAHKLPISIILEDIRSLANVGAIFRLCDAFLLEKLYLCGITGFPPHRSIHRTALGAENCMSWEYHKNIRPLIEDLIKQQHTVFAVEQTTDSIMLNNIHFDRLSPLKTSASIDNSLRFNKKGYNAGSNGHDSKKYVFVFGNEVEGVKEETIKICNHSIEIPQFGTKHSLNISSAASIVIWEAIRQIKLNFSY